MSQEIENTMVEVVEYLKNCPLGREKEQIVEYIANDEDDYYEVHDRVSKALESLDDQGRVLITDNTYRLMGE